MPASMPQRIGRFHPLAVLGKGAQGVVYRAHDSDLGRDVAIKTLFRGSSDNRLLINEARNVGRLQHGSIVPLYEIGSFEERPYLVYQLKDGQSLKERIENGPAMTVHQQVHILMHLLDAIGYAHKQGIIHRDLTPSNILLDSRELPHVLDFGVSGLIETVNTATTIVGTVGYMAPELLANGEVSPNSDQFSLGVILYEMLTGQRLFKADNDMATIYQITNESIQPPTRLNPKLDKELSDIVMTALAHNPADRYHNCEAMKLALDKYLQPSEQQDDANKAVAGGALDFLMRRIRRNPDFPAVSQHISEITQKTSGQSEVNSHDLAQVILSDYALTTKLLRLVNSATFGQYGGQISTVSRAVVILGFEQIRMAALSIMLFDHLKNGAQADALKDAACSAFLSGVFAKRMSTEFQLDPEQAFITAMFHMLGKHMTIYYFSQEYDEITELMHSKGIKESLAARQILGVSYTELGTAIAREWQLPEAITAGMRSVQRPKKTDNPLEKNALLASCCNEIAAIAGAADSQQTAELRLLSERYKELFPLDTGKLENLIQDSVPELNSYADILQVNVRNSGFYQNLVRKNDIEESVAASSAQQADNEATSSVATASGGQTASAASETPAHSPDPMMMLNAITEISNSLLSGDFELNAIINMILETIYRGMGFHRVMFCLRDSRSKRMTARYGLGHEVDELLPHFSYPLDNSQDLFNLAVNQRRDFVVIDVFSDTYQGKVPQWCKDLMDPHTLVLFPVCVNKTCIGLLYADTGDADATFSADMIKMFGSLRNQAALAIQQKHKR